MPENLAKKRERSRRDYVKHREARLAKHREWNRDNPEKAASYRRKSNQESQTIINQLKRWPCLDCGGIFPACAMDFHHRDPAEKEFTIGRNRLRRQDFAEEWAKCDLLCATCHRIRHG